MCPYRFKNFINTIIYNIIDDLKVIVRLISIAMLLVIITTFKKRHVDFLEN